MAGNTNFDTLTSTTLMNYKKTMTDNIFTANPLFYWLKEKNQMKTDDSGGTKIVVPLMYGMNNTAKSYNGYDVIDVIPQEGMDAVEYEWKQYAVGISISGREEFQNSGEGRLINLLEAKIKQAELSLIDLFATDLFKAAASVGTNDLVSIPTAITATGYGALGNITSSSSANTWWKNYFDASATKTTTDYDNLLSDVFLLLLSTAKGNDRCDIGIMPAAVYSGLEGLLVKTINFIPQLKNTKAVDVGYDNYRIKGCTIMYDENTPTGYAYFLNTKYIQLVTGAGKDFVNTPFIKPDNGDYKTCHILWYGNLVCSNRARQGYLGSIT